MVTKDRLCIFGGIVDGKLHLSKIGKIARLEWERLPFHFPEIKTGEFVVMPDHIHGILHIVESQVRATLHSLPGTTLGEGIDQQLMSSCDGRSPQQESTGQVRATLQSQLGILNSKNIDQWMITPYDGGSSQPPKGPKPGSIGAIIGQYKSRVTKRIWRDPKSKGQEIWQRNYYEHIIRDEDEYNRIAQYILDNPLNWAKDEDN